MLPMLLAFGACSSLGTIPMLFIALLIFPTLGLNSMPVYSAFLIFELLFNIGGMLSCLIAVAAAVILFAISNSSKKKLFKLTENSSFAGLMLAGALTMTALKTNDYFGIGASGNTFVEMLKSYGSLGFHPNWRGILYGTIVMVIMITFPRKFKSASKTVSAAFIAVIFTLILNIFLIPNGAVKAIAEVGKVPYIQEQLVTLSVKSVLFSVLCGAALWIMHFEAGEISEKEIRSRSFSVILLSLAASVMLCFDLRIPVASLAVVLIVGAWQSVQWGRLKKAFSSPLSFICFTAVLIISLIFNLAAGAVAAAVLSLIFTPKNPKTSK